MDLISCLVCVPTCAHEAFTRNVKAVLRQNFPCKKQKQMWGNPLSYYVMAQSHSSVLLPHPYRLFNLWASLYNVYVQKAKACVVPSRILMYLIKGWSYVHWNRTAILSIPLCQASPVFNYRWHLITKRAQDPCTPTKTQSFSLSQWLRAWIQHNQHLKMRFNDIKPS